MSAGDVVFVRFHGRSNEQHSSSALTISEFESLMYVMAWLLDRPGMANQDVAKKMLAAMQAFKASFRDASR
jgi:uncharacterized membrane protein YccC